MDQAILRGKLDEFLNVIPHAFKIADPVRKAPKGLVTVIEREISKKNHEDKQVIHKEAQGNKDGKDSGTSEGTKPL
jgi:hypothetical protein